MMNFVAKLSVVNPLKGLIQCGRYLLIRSKQVQYCYCTANNTPMLSFMHCDLEIIKAKPEQMQKKPEGELQFSEHFSDHMLEIEWTLQKGWSRPLISPFHILSLHPAAKVFHYAIELFEGMKAHRCDDGKIYLFRPDMNMERMYRTAMRSSLPTFDKNELLKLICELVKLDADWVPKSPNSLYIRPTMISNDPQLGITQSTRALLFVVTSPVGQYFSTGFQPVSLYADPEYCRAFPGGVGQYKMGCNYAPTISVGNIAASKGCQQVLYLYGEKEHITEVGAMNIFIYWKNSLGENELVTAPLFDGIILPGVIRDSILHLARQMPNIKVNERYIQMNEIRRAIKEERMYEMFGTGTACVVSPVDRILYKDPKTGDFEELMIPTMIHEPNLMQKFHKMIIDIQYGRTKMPEWTLEVV